jgi:ubiquinone/menaquinone biosynthesis C-methylase UbiE
MATEVRNEPRPRYIHAMGRRALTPLYDPFVRAFMRERVLRQRLIDRLSLRPGSRLLDVGSGTGTFAILAKQACRLAEVTGVDGDPAIIARARSKADRVGAEVHFEVALATALPFEEGVFDRVTSTFVMHHLPRAAKARACVEAFRVLHPGGEFHVVDFGPPRSRIGRTIMSALRGVAELADNLDGRLPHMLEAAGFGAVREEGRLLTPFGPAIFLRAVRSAADGHAPS